ncbi:hypothetical protein [Prochlorococcus marinus]|uniref:hypothetical protein n=1 Tax=Prochlorococcus TaxID=1218 RepID=UPI0007B35111|nr:hypothetical protein [Prochlorococcus marinus]
MIRALDWGGVAKKQKNERVGFLVKSQALDQNKGQPCCSWGCLDSSEAVWFQMLFMKNNLQRVEFMTCTRILSPQKQLKMARMAGVYIKELSVYNDRLG